MENDRPIFSREPSSATLVASFQEHQENGTKDPKASFQAVKDETSTLVAAREEDKDQHLRTEGRDSPHDAEKGDLPPKIIHFDPKDPENPLQWTQRRKWRAISGAFMFTFCITGAITSYNKGIPSMEDIGATELTGLMGSSSLMTTVAFGPLILAPLSERYGRRWLITLSFLIFALLWIPEALSPEIDAIIATRALQGFVGSVGNTVVGGTVADCFPSEERGLPMTWFCSLIIGNQALSAVWGGYAEKYLGWRWIGWINLIVSGVGVIYVIFVLEETRGETILSKRAIRLSKETGRPHTTEFDIANSSRSVIAALKTSLCRPIIFLVTEPIVAFWSLWIGLVWAQVFMLYAGAPVVFDVYGFDVAQKGLVFLSVLIAAFFTFAVSWLQDVLYARDRRKSPLGIAPPESRLYLCCIGAIGVPVSFFIYAGTARESVHWFWPCLALFLFNIFLFPIYQTVNTYIADAYETYASSALSASAFLRNLSGGWFPVFTPIMYQRLGNTGASCLLGGLAAIFIPIPFVLLKYGERIRRRSKVSRVIAEQQELRALQQQRELEARQKEEA